MPLWAKRLEGPKNLLMIDCHDDQCSPSVELSRLKEVRDSDMSEDDFHTFVHEELAERDNDWVRTGMELGLIGDVLLFGARMTENLDEADDEDSGAGDEDDAPNDNRAVVYRDQSQDPHRTWDMGHIWEELRHAGTLVDRARNHRAWAAVGWEGTTFRASNQFVLDIDLDWLSAQTFGRTYAVPRPVVESLLVEVDGDRGQTLSALDFLRAATRSASLVTIARESECCGGTEESQRILETVDGAVWGGALSAAGQTVWRR